MAGALEQFPLLMAALKEEIRRELLEELGRGEWIDQNHPNAVLGRNKHVKACKRLMRAESPDAHYHDGKWLIRASAMDQEVQRANRRLVESGRLDTDPPPAPVEPLDSLPKMPLAKALPEIEPEDETGIYALGWLERMRGAR